MGDSAKQGAVVLVDKRVVRMTWSSQNCPGYRPCSFKVRSARVLPSGLPQKSPSLPSGRLPVCPAGGTLGGLAVVLSLFQVESQVARSAPAGTISLPPFQARNHLLAAARLHRHPGLTRKIPPMELLYLSLLALKREATRRLCVGSR